MPFLVVAGITVIVQDRSAAENKPRPIGASDYAFDGTLRSSVRNRKRSWSFTTNPMTDAQVATLRTAIETGTGIVACSGDALGGTVNCEVIIDGVDYIRDRSQVTDFQRTVRLALNEA
jgi:hypothetical protein